MLPDVVVQPQRALGLLRRLDGGGGHRRHRRPWSSRRHHRCVEWHRAGDGACSGVARRACTSSWPSATSPPGSRPGRPSWPRSPRIDVLELDLSSIASIRRFASEFDSLNLPLNILINNAGVMTRNCTLSCDGLELHFAINHIGHFLLTNLLLENVKKTCRDSCIQGRIINLTSSGHCMTYREGICFDKVHDPSGLNDFVAYGQSKLANILHSNELSRILKEEGVNISANAVHPGVITTNLFRNRTIVSALLNSIGRIICRTVEQGAATTCYVAMHPQVKGISGKYFINCDIASPSSQASDVELAKKLWQFSLKIVT